MKAAVVIRKRLEGLEIRKLTISRFQARRVYLDFPLEAGEGEGGATVVDYGLQVGTTDDSLYATSDQHLFNTIQPGQQDATTPVLSLFPVRRPFFFYTTFS